MTPKIKLHLAKPVKKHPKPFLSTGSAILNLGITGSTKRGFMKGTGILLVGDSSTGKTFFAMTCFAEAAKNPAFDKYQFRFNNAENGMMIPVKKFFGRAVAKRFTSTSSHHLEDFYDDLDDTLEKGPCIYILDSMDALVSSEDDKKAKESKAARKANKKITGTMAMSKPKKNSQNLPRIIRNLEKTGSILIIIAQTRDNVGFGAMFNPKTRSGGHAMKFFAHVELWTSIIKKLKQRVNDKDRVIGANVRIDIKKNRMNGWEGNVMVPFIKNYGLDDIGSCIDFLVEEGHWKENSGTINSDELQFRGKKKDLIDYIENNPRRVKRLHIITKRVWKEIENKAKPKRVPKYS